MSRHMPLILASACLLHGCASLKDPEKVRQEHIQAFSQTLEADVARELQHPLSLIDCQRIAMARNYDVRQAALKQALSELDKDIAFANFLPTVTAKAGLTTWSRPQRMNGAQLSDKTTRTAQIDATLPILVPAVWFMYANSQLGAEVSELAAHFTRQAITLSVSISYYQCLIAEDRVATLTAQTAAAKSQYERVKGLADEGFVTQWECGQAHYLHEARAAELEKARRNLQTTYGELLEAMGFAPTHAIALSRNDMTLELPQATMEELILQALSSHPSLSIADRNIVMQENAVRKAIADFLPTLGAFVHKGWTSDSFTTPARTLYGGFSAAMDLFKGFANTAAYKQAKLHRKSAELDREATFLSIMLEVMKSVAKIQDATAELKVGLLAYETAKAKADDFEKRQKEGLLPMNELLDAQADRDDAQAVLDALKYQQFLALANLKMAMGTIEPPPPMEESAQDDATQK